MNDTASDKKYIKDADHIINVYTYRNAVEYH
jgi:hypothetical protein